VTKAARGKVDDVGDGDEDDPLHVPVCRLGCYDHHVPHFHHNLHSHHHHQQPLRLPIFFVLSDASDFWVKGKG